MNHDQLKAMAEVALDYSAPAWRNVSPEMAQAILEGLMTKMHEAFMRVHNDQSRHSS